MKTIKVIKSKKPKTKSRVAKAKKPVSHQHQTQTVIINTTAPRKRPTHKSLPKPPALPTQGLPIRMNNPAHVPIIVNKETNQLSELIKSLQFHNKVHAEPPRVTNALEKTKGAPIETQTEPEFDEQGVYNTLQNASKGVSLEKQFQTPVVVNKPLSLLGETVTSDYPAFRSMETQTARTFRLGDLLRDSGQDQTLQDLYAERQQVLGRKLGLDLTPSIFSTQPASTSLVSSIGGNPALENVELVSEKQTAPLTVSSNPPSLVSLVDQSTPTPSDDSPSIELPPEVVDVEELPPEVVETRAPDEPPVAEEVKQADIPMAFGGTFAPVVGLEALNLPEKEKPVPSSLIKTPYLGGVNLPPIEEEGLNAVKKIQENAELFPKQGKGLLGKAHAEDIDVTIATPYKAPKEIATATFEKWKELNKALIANDRNLRFRTEYVNEKGGRSKKSTQDYLTDIHTIEPNWIA